MEENIIIVFLVFVLALILSFRFYFFALKPWTLKHADVTISSFHCQIEPSCKGCPLDAIGYNCFGKLA